jgi:hypothetical protein
VEEFCARATPEPKDAHRARPKAKTKIGLIEQRIGMNPLELQNSQRE